MLLKAKGVPYKINKPIVGRISRNPHSTDEKDILITENDLLSKNLESFAAVLTSIAFTENRIELPSVYSIPSFNHLVDGDIIVINTDGVINTLYRVESHHNFLLVTERCNSNCLMCSQPPRDKDDIRYLFDVHRQLLSLIPKDCQEIGITGGEPTLMGEYFFELLELMKTELPETEIHCLTNGRAFAWNGIAQRVGQMNYNRLMLGIPVYSDFYQMHDYIVQAKDAFDQTIRGLYNLAVYDQRIEIRIVLHKQSVPRLTKLARYIYKNLPFIEHIAFMGLENQGYTPHNIEKLWIDPIEYMDELGDAAEFLSSRGMNVSIYNSQLCVMPQVLWKYNKKSISDWKNIYLDECNKCVLINSCGGLFASNAKMHSNYLKAFSAISD